MRVTCRSLDTTVHWQARCTALNLITQAVDEAPQELAACLPEIIPSLTPCMTDTKKEVKSASKATMTKVINGSGANNRGSMVSGRQLGFSVPPLP